MKREDLLQHFKGKDPVKISKYIILFNHPLEIIAYRMPLGNLLQIKPIEPVFTEHIVGKIIKVVKLIFLNFSIVFIISC